MSSSKKKVGVTSRPIYTSKGNFVSGKQVQSVGEEIARLSAESGGKITPKRLVLAAKDKSSPLHELIWKLNDAEAAMQHRIYLARKIMADIEVEIHETQVPAFVNIQDGTGYEPAETAYQNVDTVQALLELVRRDAVAFYHKHSRVRDATGVAPVFEAIEKTFPEVVPGFSDMSSGPNAPR